ncbi:MAG: alpha/beta hydrolase, partial [Pseudomonadota bacterium]
MFEGFAHHRIAVNGTDIDLVAGGSGPPLLLLHGFPQTRAAWDGVAQRLLPHYSLVIPDLPGYGASQAPDPTPAHDSQSKRRMAATLIAVMTALGHQRFFLAGHDRGGRVAYRMALDWPGRVAGLALLDIMTTLDTWEAMDWQAALAAYHWPFLALPPPTPERMIGADPAAYLDHLIDRWKGRGAALPAPALAAYHAAFAKPAVIAAMCEDYRAGADIDIRHDRADRTAGRRIDLPLLVLR